MFTYIYVHIHVHIYITHICIQIISNAHTNTEKRGANPRTRLEGRDPGFESELLHTCGCVRMTVVACVYVIRAIQHSLHMFVCHLSPHIPHYTSTTRQAPHRYFNTSKTSTHTDTPIPPLPLLLSLYIPHFRAIHIYTHTRTRAHTHTRCPPVEWQDCPNRAVSASIHAGR